MTQSTNEEKLIRGYQYGADKSYIGYYDFPNNEDKDEIHVPPNTTLVPPPTVTELGKEAAFDEATGEWTVRDEDLSWMDAETRQKFEAHRSQLATSSGAGTTQGVTNGS